MDGSSIYLYHSIIRNSILSNSIFLPQTLKLNYTISIFCAVLVLYSKNKIFTLVLFIINWEWLNWSKYYKIKYFFWFPIFFNHKFRINFFFKSKKKVVGFDKSFSCVNARKKFFFLKTNSKVECVISLWLKIIKIAYTHYFKFNFFFFYFKKLYTHTHINWIVIHYKNDKKKKLDVLAQSIIFVYNFN